MERLQFKDTNRLIALVDRLEIMVLAILDSGVVRGPGGEVHLDKVIRIIRMIASTDRIIRGFERYNIHLKLCAQMVWDTRLRTKMRTIIGGGAIRRWWQKYNGRYPAHSRAANDKAKPQKTRAPETDDKIYALHAVPGYVPKPRGPYGSREYQGRSRVHSPPILFYPWELEGKPAPRVSSACGGSPEQQRGDGGCAQELRQARCLRPKTESCLPSASSAKEADEPTPPASGGRKKKRPPRTR